MEVYSLKNTSSLEVFFKNFERIIFRAWVFIATIFLLLCIVLMFAKGSVEKKIGLWVLYLLLIVGRFGVYEFYRIARMHRSIIKSVSKEASSGNFIIDTCQSNFLRWQLKSKRYVWKDILFVDNCEDFISKRMLEIVESQGQKLGRMIKVSHIDKELLLVFEEEATSIEISEQLKLFS